MSATTPFSSAPARRADPPLPGPTPAPGSTVPLGRRPRRVVAAVVVAAVLADLAVQSRAGGVAAATMVALLCVALVRVGWVVRRGGRVLLGGAVAVSAFLVLRASPWLVLMDLAVVAVLMALGCSAERGGRPFDTRFATTVRRLGSTVASTVVAIGPLARGLPLVVPGARAQGRGTVRAILRGLAVAVPVVAVVAINLASADAVFASLFDVDLQVDRWLGHGLVLLLAAWWATGWFVQASRPPVSHPARELSVGAVEATVVMVGLISVYAAFAWTQWTVARRGPEYVLATTGLTYAQYARSGFFQLLWVAGATAVVLLVLRSVVVPRDAAAARCISVAGAVAAALTLVVVHAAIVRLDLYETAFGLTLLRFSSSAFAWWLGGVFVLIGLWFALGRRSSRDWLPTALGLLSLTAVLALNLMGPEATVVRHNLERARSGAEFDAAYALRLSDDAVPTLEDGLDELAPQDAELLVDELCGAPQEPVRWTLSERAAARSLHELCG